MSSILLFDFLLTDQFRFYYSTIKQRQACPNLTQKLLYIIEQLYLLTFIVRVANKFLYPILDSDTNLYYYCDPFLDYLQEQNFNDICLVIALVMFAGFTSYIKGNIHQQPADCVYVQLKLDLVVHNSDVYCQSKENSKLLKNLIKKEANRINQKFQQNCPKFLNKWIPIRFFCRKIAKLQVYSKNLNIDRRKMMESQLRMCPNLSFKLRVKLAKMVASMDQVSVWFFVIFCK